MTRISHNADAQQRNGRLRIADCPLEVKEPSSEDRRGNVPSSFRRSSAQTVIPFPSKHKSTKRTKKLLQQNSSCLTDPIAAAVSPPSSSGIEDGGICLARKES
jgi:hypothetical protein